MLDEVLKRAVESGASDVFIVAGIPVTYKVKGAQVRSDEEIMKPASIEPLVDEIYQAARRSKENFESGSDDDFSFSMPALGRFRVNVFRQRGSVAAVIRVIRFGIPDPKGLGIPESVLSLADNKTGLVLVTGATGSGKSTTLACMIDRINRSREDHIITMEDPIEYVHQHNKSIVSQREVFIDTPGYLESLRSALRESPDVILLGEMRDYGDRSAPLQHTSYPQCGKYHKQDRRRIPGKSADAGEGSALTADQRRRMPAARSDGRRSARSGFRSHETDSGHPEHDQRGQAPSA